VLIGAAAILAYATWAAARGPGDPPDLADLPPPPPESAAPSRGPSAEELATAEILVAHEGYRRAVAAAWRAGAPDHPDLAQFADGEVVTATAGLIGSGFRWVGAPRVVAAEVIRVDLAAEPPIAELAVCVDATGFSLESDAGPADFPVVGDIVPGQRHSVSTHAELSEDGRWRIVESLAIQNAEIGDVEC
jgi:hypothetical protein